MSERSSEKKVAVYVPEDLHRAIENQIVGKGFSTVDAYVTYVLNVAIGKKQQESSGEEDNARIEARLKALGYL